jgi:glycerophosphoryl diester phosphodiesterase
MSRTQTARMYWTLLVCVLTSTCACAQSPLVIAHRGASGYLAEHTIEAYTLAVGMGADVIEPDVVLTKDGHPICSHDLTCEKTDAHEKFPDRARSDGKWYFADLTLSEVLTLEVRTPLALPGQRVMTLDAMLDTVRTLSARLDRTIGVIPEPKHPAWHREHGLELERAVLDALSKHGYTDPQSGAVIQCFDMESLLIMRNELGCTLPMVFLTGEEIPWDLIEANASWLHGIGPSRKTLEHEDGSPTANYARMVDLGLGLYPYTFKDDAEATARMLARPGITGIFTDFPDVARAALDAATEAHTTVVPDIATRQVSP